ncbi:MAG: hypothetical protein ACKV19_22300 [Verrucomicrobiales bacterium]
MNRPPDNPPPGGADSSELQPLREIGTEDKSQYWDFEDITRALREARRLGIAPERLFQRAAEEPLAQAS